MFHCATLEKGRRQAAGNLRQDSLTLQGGQDICSLPSQELFRGHVGEQAPQGFFGQENGLVRESNTL